jgi:hypothetical protein
LFCFKDQTNTSSIYFSPGESCDVLWWCLNLPLSATGFKRCSWYLPGCVLRPLHLHRSEASNLHVREEPIRWYGGAFCLLLDCELGLAVGERAAALQVEDVLGAVADGRGSQWSRPPTPVPRNVTISNLLPRRDDTGQNLRVQDCLSNFDGVWYLYGARYQCCDVSEQGACYQRVAQHHVCFLLQPRPRDLAPGVGRHLPHRLRPRQPPLQHAQRLL